MSLVALLRFLYTGSRLDCVPVKVLIQDVDTFENCTFLFNIIEKMDSENIDIVETIKKVFEEGWLYFLKNIFIALFASFHCTSSLLRDGHFRIIR